MDNTRFIEQKMAEWLAHPMEFGEFPEKVRLKHRYKVDLVTCGEIDVHLVDYTMPDGTTGRGFVNGELTWSFFAPEIESIKDDELFVAYCGWASLFPEIRNGTVKTEFASSGEEAKYLARKREEGFTDIQVTARFKIGKSEITEFKAMRNDVAIAGAGDTAVEIIVPASDPRFNLPAIYFLLGEQAILSGR